ncbi:MAG TPA: hypothetical protein VJ953_22475 [Saprospiraceae bacterium]|nr:hypothetical protein [Saprospiraceae bacterium]
MKNQILINGLLVLLLLTNINLAFAQTENTSDAIPQIYPGAIPSSPAFSLLGVNPEIVLRPSDIKEFKVDWRIKNYNLAPDLALEFQPLWWFYYRNKGLNAYRKVGPLGKILSTTSISMATAKVDNLNHIGYAIKWNLYKEKDPYLDETFQKEFQQNRLEQLAPIQEELDTLYRQMNRAVDGEEKIRISDLIIAKQFEIKALEKQLMDDAQTNGYRYIQEHWNMDMLDFSFGLVQKYDNGGLDSLKMRYAGFGLWINGAKGIGQRGLLTGLVRLNKIGENTDFLVGASYRYGSQKFNFFAEVARHRIGNNFQNGFNEEEVFAAKLDQDIGTGWYEFGDGESTTMTTLAFGGDFRLRYNILLNFALRTQLRKDVGFERFLPVANVVCLMN